MPKTLDEILRENSTLTAQVATLTQERDSLKSEVAKLKAPPVPPPANKTSLTLTERCLLAKKSAAPITK